MAAPKTPNRNVQGWRFTDDPNDPRIVRGAIDVTAPTPGAGVPFYLRRFFVQNLSNNPETAVEWLRSQGIDAKTIRVGSDNEPKIAIFTPTPDGADQTVTLLDPTRFEWANDFGDIAISFPLSMLGMGLGQAFGTPVGAAVGSGIGGGAGAPFGPTGAAAGGSAGAAIGAPVGAISGSAIGGMAAESLRQEIGQWLGLNKHLDRNQIRNEAIIGGAGPIFGKMLKGVGKAAVGTARFGTGVVKGLMAKVATKSGDRSVFDEAVRQIDNILGGKVLTAEQLATRVERLRQRFSPSSAEPTFAELRQANDMLRQASASGQRVPFARFVDSMLRKRAEWSRGGVNNQAQLEHFRTLANKTDELLTRIMDSPSPTTPGQPFIPQVAPMTTPQGLVSRPLSYTERLRLLRQTRGSIEDFKQLKDKSHWQGFEGSTEGTASREVAKAAGAAAREVLEKDVFPAGSPQQSQYTTLMRTGADKIRALEDLSTLLLEKAESRVDEMRFPKTGVGSQMLAMLTSGKTKITDTIENAERILGQELQQAGLGGLMNKARAAGALQGLKSGLTEGTGTITPTATGNIQGPAALGQIGSAVGGPVGRAVGQALGTTIITGKGALKQGARLTAAERVGGKAVAAVESVGASPVGTATKPALKRVGGSLMADPFMAPPEDYPLNEPPLTPEEIKALRAYGQKIMVQLPDLPVSEKVKIAQRLGYDAIRAARAGRRQIEDAFDEAFEAAPRAFGF